MSETCQFKRGFFTLRVCNRVALQRCEQCAKPSCHFHLSAQSGMRSCVNCVVPGGRQTGSDYDDDWVYSYRNRYYESGYAPYRYGHHDYNSFDSTDDEIDDYDDDSGAGDFSDS